MTPINTQNIISILMRALNGIDPRLVDHGTRVAYIVYKIMCMSGDYGDREKKELMVLAMLHDVGAYKTEEINNMVQFETKDVWAHSIYGYLFIKNMTPLKGWAEAILYHHLDYAKARKPMSRTMKVAGLFNLADRIDVLLELSGGFLDTAILEKHKGKKFDPDMVELFVKANEKYNIVENLKAGNYAEEVSEQVFSLEYEEETLLEYIKMIAYSIDFRSEHTVTHVISTVGISAELGRLMDLTEEEQKQMLLGAYLHDIGKIATPLSILEKPGPLSKGEYSLMKDHIQGTRHIIGDSLGEEVLQIAYRHHEKIDGSGYPQGLCDEDLTTCEKILSIADIMSALTGKRSYKERFNKERVTSILEKQREDRKICPKITDVAVQNYDAIMESIHSCCQEITNMYLKIKEEYIITLEEMHNAY